MRAIKTAEYEKRAKLHTLHHPSGDDPIIYDTSKHEVDEDEKVGPIREWDEIDEEIDRSIGEWERKSRQQGWGPRRVRKKNLIRTAPGHRMPRQDEVLTPEDAAKKDKAYFSRREWDRQHGYASTSHDMDKQAQANWGDQPHYWSRGKTNREAATDKLEKLHSALSTLTQEQANEIRFLAVDFEKMGEDVLGKSLRVLSEAIQNLNSALRQVDLDGEKSGIWDEWMQRNHPEPIEPPTEEEKLREMQRRDMGKPWAEREESRLQQ